MKKGFTLIELVVVIVILGILAAIAVPKYVDLTTKANEAHDKSALSSLRASTHMLYAKNVLDGNNTWPAESAVTDNITPSGMPTWKHYASVSYNDSNGVWTATE